MTKDWDELQDRASQGMPDLAELKQRIDLVGVCLAVGIGLEPADDTGDRWTGLCVFHDDTNPSFAVWFDHEDQCQRCGCWSCDFGTGDVFDLVQHMLGLSLPQAVHWLQEYEQLNPNFRPPRAESSSPAPEVDLPALTVEAKERALVGHLDPLRTLLVQRGVNVPAEWLVEQFHIGVDDDGSVIIPHVGQDGSVQAVKRRRYPDWTPRAVKGSKLTQLYGVHRVQGHTRVMLCEGESDTWTVAYLMRNQDVDVVGLPSGAGPNKPPRQEWIDLLLGRDVTFILDADEAGRAGLREWLGKLKIGRVTRLDEGLDASTAGQERLWAAIEHALPIGEEWEPGLKAVGGGMIRASGDTPVANFSLHLYRTVIIADEELIFEVMLPDRRLAFLSTHDLGSDARLVAWANRHGYVWYGSRKDAQELMRMLRLEGLYRPQVRGTRVAGWHEGSFVLPMGNIGDSTWAYVPPVADVDISKKIHLRPETFDPAALTLLPRLHQRNVITPILGWIAAAPLRALCAKFPSLGVVGGAGHGKTTLLDTVLKTFGYELSLMLTATTTHGVQSLAASTNAIPVWVDEFRSGARRDTRLALEQLIRDAWDGGVSMKGGLHENRQKLTSLPALAPLVITGEDLFSETSHMERMAIIVLPSRGRDADALGRLLTTNTAGLGRAYLEWLTGTYARHELSAPPFILDRMQQVRAVVTWGWELLAQFAHEQCGVDIGDVDMSLVEETHRRATEVPIIVDMLAEFYDRRDRRGDPIVWGTRDGDLCVRVPDFVQAVDRETDVKLPGGSRATKAWLMDRWEAEELRCTFGRHLRLKGALTEVVGALPFHE